MKLTNKLLSFLHRVFDKDPAPFLALRLRYAGTGMTWRIAGARLTTVPVAGSGQAIAVDLTQYTLGELVNYLASQPGYTVEYADHSELSLLGAAVLLDGTGDQAKSNGDHLYGYTNVLWSYLEASSLELDAAAAQIDQMLLQMETQTASDVWLDELGGYYGVPRLQDEVDAPYSLRIIAEVLRPRGNNVAIEAAITAYTGQVTKVIDVTLNTPLSPLYNGADTHNGVRFYNSTSSPLYGLFDVEYGYDLINGGDISSFAVIVRGLIDRLRDAGTHLRALSLKGSDLADTVSAPDDSAAMPVDAGVVFGDTVVAQSEDYASAGALAVMEDIVANGSDDLSISFGQAYQYSGIRFYNGDITHSAGSGATETV